MNFAPGAWRYALPAFVAAPLVLVFSPLAAVGLTALGAAVLAFFRDPERTPPLSGTVAPADGTVSVLRSEGGRTRLGIFMNVWHVHVVRSPFDATVVDVEHVPGAYKPAFSKESDRNERVHVTLELDAPERIAGEGDLVTAGDDVGAEAGTDVPEASDEAGRDGPTTKSDGAGVETEGAAETEAGVEERDEEELEERDEEEREDPEEATVTLIAGAFARRIHPYVEPGDRIERGERIGHIAFGSRVDVLFPPSVDLSDVAVEPGESTTAGETVVLPPADSDIGFTDPAIDS